MQGNNYHRYINNELELLAPTKIKLGKWIKMCSYHKTGKFISHLWLSRTNYSKWSAGQSTTVVLLTDINPVMSRIYGYLFWGEKMALSILETWLVQAQITKLSLENITSDEIRFWMTFHLPINQDCASWYTADNTHIKPSPRRSKKFPSHTSLRTESYRIRMETMNGPIARNNYTVLED